MKTLFRYIFNHDQMATLRELANNLQDRLKDHVKTIDVYRERNKQLEDQVKELESYKLKYEITKLYVEDDEALLELFEANRLFEENFKKAEKLKRETNIDARNSYSEFMIEQANRQIQALGGHYAGQALVAGQIQAGTQLAGMGIKF